ncbi:hypothetical protein AMAG_02288 [Allomyces macrogynus ATCC 38327]|uniref:SWR1-complex protein 4 n=1 Tax=Allomyces macrogynus (strain ATCC 38327) TaxID=578462 RepID=A0A0L0S1T0_ALLM3|nr:hypothetical protein AMAG_02288 [Allomyces macrogynus ATCC 38327]|eukprot:KNE56488.1 hypothetical protein AMAG_02288 [Allomyces macrogynus ATCC 38327]
MNGVHDMLAPDPNSAGSDAQPPAPPPSSESSNGKRRKAERDLQQELGVSSEVLHLMGDIPPPILVTSRPALKPQIRHSRAMKWEWRPFTSSARTDGLALRHWANASENDDADYRFSSFNKQVDVVQYTDDEYERGLGRPDWTREETDQLMALCRQFDLRFPVIYDRWENVPSQPVKDIEDLKERYVEVSRNVLSMRNPLPDPSQKAALASLQFDKFKERERKRHLDLLFSRTQEEVDEEARLHAELLQHEERHAKLAKDRQEVISRFYKGLDPQEFANYNTKRRMIREASMNQAPTIIEGVTVTTEKLTPGLFLRSSKLSSVKPAMQAKYLAVIQELGIRPTDRPRMGTGAVSQRFEELKANVLQLLELRKMADKIETDLRVHSHKRDLMVAGGVAADAKRAAESPAVERDRKRVRR